MKFVLSYIEYFMGKYDFILLCCKINICEVIRIPPLREVIVSVIINIFCRNFLLDFLGLIIAVFLFMNY